MVSSYDRYSNGIKITFDLEYMEYIEKFEIHICILQGRNHGKNLDATSAMVGRICPPGEDRVKVSENLGAPSVARVAPVDTSLLNLSNNLTCFLMEENDR